MNKTILHNGAFLSVNPWRMLTWLLIAQIMVAFVGRSLAPLGVLIGDDLSLTKAQIGMLPAALFLGQSLIAIPAGFLVDRVGSKRLLFLLSLCLGLSFILMAVTSFYWLILLLVVLGGAGYGAMHPTSNKGILYWFSEKRGTAMGIKQMGVTLGSALAALLLFPAAVAFGWRPVMIGACVLLILTGIFAYRFYLDPQAEQEKSGASEKPARLFASILQLFKEKPLVLVSLGAMGLSGSQLILNTYIVLFAYESLGIPLVLAGMLLVISEVSGSFGRVAWGMISDSIFHGKRIIVLVIVAAVSIGVALGMALLPPGTPFWVLVPITILFGFCISGFNGIWMNAATELVPIGQAGIASGFSLMLGSWGVIIGPPLFGYIVDATGAFTYAWLFMAGILTVVIVLLLAAMRIVKKESEEKGE